MFRMSHDAVDFFSADFTAAGVIVGGEGGTLGVFFGAGRGGSGAVAP